MAPKYTIFTVVVLIALAASVSAVCNTRGVAPAALLGCGGTDICKYDTSADTTGSANNNLCCQYLAGGASQCVKASQVGAPGSYQCFTQSTSGLCPLGNLALYTGGTNEYGRWTCNSDAACAGADGGKIHCVQHLPGPGPAPGYKICQV